MQHGAAYQDLAAHCRAETNASGVVLIVLDGHAGNGIAVEADPMLGLSLPNILRLLADEMDARRLPLP